MNGDGPDVCDLPAKPTIADFVRVGRNDCVFNFGDAGSMSFAVPVDDERERSPMRKSRKKDQPEEGSPMSVDASTPITTTATMPPVAGPTTATIGVADNAISEVKSLVPADGNANMITVALAVVGVAGGGAAFKLYQNMVKSKHEKEMKKLEIEEQRSQKQDDQHSQCNAARVALEAKVAALMARVEELAAKPAGAPSVDLGDFNPEEIEDRLAKVESLVKPKARRR